MIVVFYLLIINVVGFISMGYDKRKAQQHEWRVPENKLWLIAWIGGAIGSWLGMSVFHHKTKHTTFVVGMPILLIIHIILYFVIKARLLS
ncbi:DUF1294 domain-containing protein [Pontibacillus salicampi]|uniref:DUF1294 domain-containing protein n=1 Tax=Pontibacillus salicampi TaxID=1449801 RepID=A0ABV6LJ68_9BACI